MKNSFDLVVIGGGSAGFGAIVCVDVGPESGVGVGVGVGVAVGGIVVRRHPYRCFFWKALQTKNTSFLDAY